MEDIKSLFESQIAHFKSLDMKDIERRRSLLLKLKDVILQYEPQIVKALAKDLGKPEFEAVISETQFVIGEINYALKKLKRWSKPKRVWSPLVHFPSKSYIEPNPLGSVLIIGPWNYPFQLLLSPVVGALAAGNNVIVKPSEVSSETSQVVFKMISENFNSKELAVVEGGIPETTALLECPFNHIFYTGNGTVGRIVMSAAAKNLTPVTLELGGKSPCLIYGQNNIELVAKRLVWGKFFNAGQTCVAPDYVLTDEETYPKLIEHIKKVLVEFYGEKPHDSADYARIINERHFERLMNYLEGVEIVVGGNTNKEECYISPTLVKAFWESKIMNEEIFGPLLPIIIENDLDKAIQKVKDKDRPLAAYLFTENLDIEQKYRSNIISGGMCINDTIVHLSTEHLPFGGVGESGMGAYHGHYSFKTFTHFKSIMIRNTWIDLALRYPPYLGKLRIIRLLLKYLF